MKNLFNIDERILKLADEAEAQCSEAFKRIDKIAEYNGMKVLSAFIKNNVSETCLHGTTGYGYDDVGRDTLDKVYATTFGCEDALVRHTIVNGTHALSTALFGVLRPGDKLLMLCGAPYDTLEEVIGKRGKKGNGSLMDYGIEYEEIELLENGMPDLDAITEKVKTATVAYIQRSRGYSTRPSYTIADIEKMIQAVKKGNPDAIIMVDNCYGEFVDTKEPTEVGADLIMGSLIKNPGGGIASTGGYIAGRKDLIEKCAYRLTVVGMGKEVGASLHQNREMYQGFFLAPEITAAAVKTSEFACALLGLLGYESLPKQGEPRADIIASILLKNEKTLTSFIKGIQKGAPIDSYLIPEAIPTPGYESPVIMAAGAFTMGASIEFSADAPIREPYAAWLQGGLTYPTGKAGILIAVQNMLEDGEIKLD
ncbi:MAG: methionine gamma-lyase family protein [Oscillospiraceae bacterium]|nr:methionine gamma-lyase family protein [Oscillospiraceae bacterium]